MRKAGFFARFLAFALDTILLSFFVCLILMATAAGFMVSAESLSAARFMNLWLIFSLSCSSIALFYFTYLTMEGGATIGKRVFGLKVVGKDGKYIGPLRAFVRSTAYLLSALLWVISLITVFLFRGRALHDMIAGTQVVYEET